MSMDAFEERLAKIRARFVSTLAAKIDESDTSASQMSGEDDAAAEVVAETYRRLHGIAGTGPTVGFSATGNAARQAEAVLIEANRERRGLNPSELMNFESALRALRDVAASELRANS